MEEKTLEYYHLKIEQILASNESLNQEKSDLQDEAEALQERINEQIKLLTNILITLGITTTRAEGERLVQGGGVLNQIEKLKVRIDELEKEASTYRDTLKFILEELYKIREEAGIESYGIDIILNVLRGNNKTLKTKEVKD